MAGEEDTRAPVSNSHIGVPTLTLEVWLIPWGVGLESGVVVPQPTATTRPNKAISTCFIAATIPPMLDGASVRIKRWMFDNAPAVIAEYKKLVQQQGGR